METQFALAQLTMPTLPHAKLKSMPQTLASSMDNANRKETSLELVFSTSVPTSCLVQTTVFTTLTKPSILEPSASSTLHWLALLLVDQLVLQRLLPQPSPLAPASFWPFWLSFSKIDYEILLPGLKEIKYETIPF